MYCTVLSVLYLAVQVDTDTVLYCTVLSVLYLAVQVDSEQFSGQQHSWQLCQLLQKGRQACRDSLHTDLAHSLRYSCTLQRSRNSPAHCPHQAAGGDRQGLSAGAQLQCQGGSQWME